MASLAAGTAEETYDITDAQGRVWKLTSVESPAAAGELENMFANAYRLEVHKTCVGAPPEVYGHALAAAAAHIDAGNCKFGGPQVMAHFQHPERRVQILQVMLRPRHGIVSAQDCHYLFANHLQQLMDSLIVLNPNTFIRPTEGGKAQNGAARDPKAVPAPSAT